MKTVEIINVNGKKQTVKNIQVMKYEEKQYVEYIVVGTNAEWKDSCELRAFLGLNPDFIGQLLGSMN